MCSTRQQRHGPMRCWAQAACNAYLSGGVPPRAHVELAWAPACSARCGSGRVGPLPGVPGATARRAAASQPPRLADPSTSRPQQQQRSRPRTCRLLRLQEQVERGAAGAPRLPLQGHRDHHLAVPLLNMEAVLPPPAHRGVAGCHVGAAPHSQQQQPATAAAAAHPKLAGGSGCCWQPSSLVWLHPLPLQLERAVGRQLLAADVDHGGGARLKADA